MGKYLLALVITNLVTSHISVKRRYNEQFLFQKLRLAQLTPLSFEYKNHKKVCHAIIKLSHVVIKVSHMIIKVCRVISRKSQLVTETRHCNNFCVTKLPKEELLIRVQTWIPLSDWLVLILISLVINPFI